MKILVLSVGRPDRRFTALFDDYAARIRRFGVTFETAHVEEVEAAGRYDDAHAREREGRALAAAIPARSKVVALDPAGVGMTSQELSRRLEPWATPRATFLIGGPLGLDPARREEAEAVLSLSAMTLPHDLARVVLAEQIYRALTLLRGIPYHK